MQTARDDELKGGPQMGRVKRPMVAMLTHGPLGPLGFNSPNIAQRHALHVERNAEKAFMLSDRD